MSAYALALKSPFSVFKTHKLRDELCQPVVYFILFHAALFGAHLFNMHHITWCYHINVV